MKNAILVLAALFIPPLLIEAQSKGVDCYSARDLRQIGHELAMQAEHNPDGIATKDLESHSNHLTMLSVRIKTGGAEVHQHYSDFFIAVDGEATLVTGGKVLDSKMTSDGETRGSALSGGYRQKLRVGDIVHIPPNKSHQILIVPGKPFTYFVIKVRE
jgi:mannose-6-phosphate isomerase-like protein (cupin superfamily)